MTKAKAKEIFSIMTCVSTKRIKYYEINMIILHISYFTYYRSEMFIKNISISIFFYECAVILFTRIFINMEIFLKKIIVSVFWKKTLFFI